MTTGGHKRFGREGGIEVVVEELSTRMVKLGHQVTCYNRGGHHVSGKEFDGAKLHEYEGVKLKTVPTINGKGLAAVSSSFFAALASAFGRYDVVHIHAEGPAAMCWIPKLFGKRVVVTIHGACEIIETTGKKPDKSRVLAASLHHGLSELEHGTHTALYAARQGTACVCRHQI